MADCERHLKACPACAKRYAELRRDLDGVKPLTPPARGEDYGEQVWQSITQLLAGIRKTQTELAPILAAARLGSRLRAADRRGLRCRAPVGAQAGRPVAVAVDPQARQRVVIVVLGDHLDRSERLLVELNHAGGNDMSAMPLRSEARNCWPATGW